jgi:hypothetical protein
MDRCGSFAVQGLGDDAGAARLVRYWPVTMLGLALVSRIFTINGTAANLVAPTARLL